MDNSNGIYKNLYQAYQKAYPEAKGNAICTFNQLQSAQLTGAGNIDQNEFIFRL